MTDIETSQRLAFLQGLGSDPDHRAPWESWPVNNSGLAEYFDPVKLDGHHEGVLAVIERQIGGTEGNAGVDMAGGTNGVALQELLRLGLIDKALVTNYRHRPNRRARRAGVNYARGNLLKPKTWQGIIDWQEEEAPGGLALVMHRPDGGMQGLDPRFYEGAVNLLLDMIRPGGVMFTQIPQILRHRRASALEPICKGVIGRPDVESVLAPKAPQKPEWARYRMPNRDCVVIIKGQEEA
jgi:hypothetical protein